MNIICTIMKGKMLILLAVICSLTACVKEEPIGSPGHDGEDISLAVTLEAGDLKTKSEPDSDKTIKNRFVAAFRDGTCVGVAYSNDGTSPMTIKAKIGEVTFLAIANAGHLSEIKAAATAEKPSNISYDGLKKLIVTGALTDSTSLIKVGEMSKTLIREDKTLTFELVQLPAFVDIIFEFKNNQGNQPCSFTVTGYSITGIQNTSKLFLDPEFTFSNGVAAANTTLDKKGLSAEKISFYTYEKETKGEGQAINVVITGVLTEGTQGGMEKKYRLQINPVKDGANSKTDGFIHGYYYTVTGTIDLNSTDITFTTASQKWEERNTDVIIDKNNFLFVRDKEIKMINMPKYETVFQSSSTVTIENVEVYLQNLGEWEIDSNVNIKSSTQIVTVTKDNDANGTITINSTIPDNFVPRKITFTVSNETLQSEKVEVIQYPPLYIEAPVSKDTLDYVDRGQNNWNIYQFTTLVPDYSHITKPTDFFTGTGKDKKEYAVEANWKSFKEAIMGYPVIAEDETTHRSDANSRMISPRFMLASQFGIVQDKYYVHAHTEGAPGNKKIDLSCRDYKQHLGDILYEDWRLPTKAELAMIDVLQHTKACAVKKILEGDYYWSASADKRLDFMNANLPTHNTTGKAFWRCVHDLKD